MSFAKSLSVQLLQEASDITENAKTLYWKRKFLKSVQSFEFQSFHILKPH